MAKSKGSRIGISLKCTICENQIKNNQILKYKNLKKDTPLEKKKTIKQNSYRTTKNRKNNPSRLELKKFCRICNSHSIYKEIK